MPLFSSSLPLSCLFLNSALSLFLRCDSSHRSQAQNDEEGELMGTADRHLHRLHTGYILVTAFTNKGITPHSIRTGWRSTKTALHDTGAGACTPQGQHHMANSRRSVPFALHRRKTKGIEGIISRPSLLSTFIVTSVPNEQRLGTSNHATYQQPSNAL
jgi:hypothetical protein